MSRTNTSTFFELRFADGTVVAEKCRNTLGGWTNMVDRLEARFGVAAHSPQRLRMADATSGTVAGLAFVVVEVCR
mgnify:CR=1|tara:strand:- start:169 stop:393 length:225 start_codon:yes stop_codon:yes gene_type:complete